MTRCDSPIACKNSVAEAKWWCPSCQVAALSSKSLGDVVSAARAPNLDPVHQARLATHPAALVRLILTERRDLTDGVRAALINDSDESVVMVAAGAVAETSSHDLFKLMYRPGIEPELLFVLAGNPTMHPRGLEFLATHPDKTIASRATENLMSMAARSQAVRPSSGSPTPV